MSAVSNSVMPRSIALLDHLARGLQIGALAEIIAAEADGGNAQARAAEITNLHGSFLLIERKAASPTPEGAPSATTL